MTCASMIIFLRPLLYGDERSGILQINAALKIFLAVVTLNKNMVHMQFLVSLLIPFI